MRAGRRSSAHRSCKSIKGKDAHLPALSEIAEKGPLIMAIDMEHLRSWIGQEETREDTVTLTPVLALSATLDRDESDARVGDVLPPLWHWLYFLPLHRQSEIGPDGHAKRGGFLPPIPLPRRMWAGGRVQFIRPLRVGDSIRRTSRIVDITRKDGRSGPLIFVLVRHDIQNAGGSAVVEEHDIVYRDLAQPEEATSTPRMAPTGAGWQRRIHPDDVLLFRYSALTFNGHRIHYDRRYVTEVEGYPGLIVHGPLIATLLADLVRRNSVASMIEFRFKAVQPLFDTADFSICGVPPRDGLTVALWAQNSSGHLAMEAEAILAT